jgi:hypothetical protein
MKRDARGNGGLGFTTPGSLERYSIVMTAEASVKAASPLGTLVLSTRGGEVTALFAKKNDLRKAARAPQVSVNPSNPVAGSLQVVVKAGSETGDVNFAVVPKPPEIKRFPSTP